MRQAVLSVPASSEAEVLSVFSHPSCAAMSHLYSLIFRSVNFNLKNCWFKWLCFGYTPFLTDCTIHKRCVLSRKKVVVFRFFWMRRNDCIDHGSNNSGSAACVPLSLNRMLFICCAGLPVFYASHDSLDLSRRMCFPQGIFFLYLYT